MELERFEPYHIGIKLTPGQDLNLLRDRIVRELRVRGYTLAPEAQIPGIILQPSIVLGIKGDVQVVLNFAANALNTVGEDPTNVSEVFKDIVYRMLPNQGYDLGVVVSFYEVIAEASVKVDKKPIEILNKAVKLDLLDDFKQRKTCVSLLKISNTFTIEDKRYLMEMVIEPSPISPNNRLSVHLVYRSTNVEEVATFHEKIGYLIIETIKLLEG